MSTPCVSKYIRKLNAEQEGSCFGGILLTASHNPGGEDEDFGIKFNTANGGPALEDLTGKIFELSTKISEFRWKDLPQVDLSVVHAEEVSGLKIEIVSNTEVYVAMLKELFDFEQIKKLV